MAWSTHKDATGRTYYYNSVTKQSSWDKPPELKSAFERALDCSDWTEYATDSGKKYYHNAVTKETTWKIPDEFQEILESMKFEAEMQVAKQQAPMVLNFDTKEEAEDAWIEMLRVVGVEPDWTWEQCVRKASSNPIYRALKTVAERKEAFETYCRETKAEKHEAKLKKQADDEKNLQKLFSETPEINGFTRFKVAERLFEENPVWTNCLPQNRKNYFFTYVDELKLAQKESNRELRKSNLAKIKNLFGVLSVSAATSWKEFQNLYSTHPLFTNDQEFSKMDVFDILVAFEDHILTLDSQFRQERQLRLKEQRRTERIIRDAYKDLLREAKRDGRLTHKSQWKDFYVTIKDDPRFTAMFGTSGSTPLELYWDVQIKMEDSYRAVRRDTKYQILPGDDYVSFKKRFYRDINPLDQKYSLIVFEEYLDRATKEEQKRIERKTKRRIDALRSVMKRLEPPIRLEDPFEAVCIRLETKPEYQELEFSERQTAYEKYMARLRDKIANNDKPSEKRRRRSPSSEGSARKKRIVENDPSAENAPPATYESEEEEGEVR